MPRSLESPIARTLRFFRESSIEIAQVALDLARDVVKDRLGLRKELATVSTLTKAVATALPAPARDPIVKPKPPVRGADGIARPAKKKPGPKPKPGRPAGKRKPGPAPLALSKAERIAREKKLQAARDQKKKERRQAEQRAAIGRVKKAAVGKPAGRRGRPRATNEAPLDLPEPGVPVEGDLDFIESQERDTLIVDNETLVGEPR